MMELSDEYLGNHRNWGIHRSGALVQPPGPPEPPFVMTLGNIRNSLDVLKSKIEVDYEKLEERKYEDLDIDYYGSDYQ